jgi:hypothetical protein
MRKASQCCAVLDYCCVLSSERVERNCQKQGIARDRNCQKQRLVKTKGVCRKGRVLRVEGGAERAQGKHINRQIDVKACALARRALISRGESGSACKLRSFLRAKSESVCCCRKELSLRLQWRQPQSRTSQDGLDNVTTVELRI